MFLRHNSDFLVHRGFVEDFCYDDLKPYYFYVNESLGYVLLNYRGVTLTFPHNYMLVQDDFEIMLNHIKSGSNYKVRTNSNFYNKNTIHSNIGNETFYLIDGFIRGWDMNNTFVCSNNFEDLRNLKDVPGV